MQAPLNTTAPKPEEARCALRIVTEVNDEAIDFIDKMARVLGDESGCTYDWAEIRLAAQEILKNGSFNETAEKPDRTDFDALEEDTIRTFNEEA